MLTSVRWVVYNSTTGEYAALGGCGRLTTDPKKIRIFATKSAACNSTIIKRSSGALLDRSGKHQGFEVKEIIINF